MVPETLFICVIGRIVEGKIVSETIGIFEYDLPGVALKFIQLMENRQIIKDSIIVSVVSSPITRIF